MNSTTPPSDPTADYYELRADEFARKTLEADVSSLRSAFLAHLPLGGSILDAGCGSGRDAAAFKQLGYRVSAFDASPTLARIASAVSGQPVAVVRFQEFRGVAEYDGVWACASLLHLRQAEIPDALARLSAALVPGGVMYCSFKRGEGEGVRGGRHFTDFTAETLRVELQACVPLEVVSVWETPDVRPDREAEMWVNALARKRAVRVSH